MVHDACHEVPVGEVAVEEAQRPGDEGQVHGQRVERQAPLIEASVLQPAVVLAEAELQEDVLPLDVEEHQPFDVDQNRNAVLVNEQVIWTELTVDEPVLLAWPHQPGQFTQHGLKLGPDGSDPPVTPRGLGQVRQSPVKDNLLAGGPGGSTTAPDEGDLSILGTLPPVHRLKRFRHQPYRS